MHTDTCIQNTDTDTGATGRPIDPFRPSTCGDPAPLSAAVSRSLRVRPRCADKGWFPALRSYSPSYLFHSLSASCRRYLKSFVTRYQSRPFFFSFALYFLALSSTPLPAHSFGPRLKKTYIQTGQTENKPQGKKKEKKKGKERDGESRAGETQPCSRHSPSYFQHPSTRTSHVSVAHRPTTQHPRPRGLTRVHPPPPLPPPLPPQCPTCRAPRRPPAEPARRCARLRWCRGCARTWSRCGCARDTSLPG